MPAQFKDLGKKAKDLFKKQYDYKNEVKVINSTSGVKIESGLAQGFAGYSKANWTDETLGKCEVELHSTGVAKAKCTIAKVVEGCDLTVAGDAAGDVSVEAVYSQDAFVASAKVVHNVDKSSTDLFAAASAGMGDITVGADVTLDSSFAPSSYNAGAQYAAGDITAAVVTGKNFSVLTALAHYKFDKKLVLGASADYNTAKGDTKFAVGTDYSLDKSTSVRAKFASDSTIGLAFSHALSNPSMKVGVSSQHNALGDNIFAAQKFGISLTFGEY